MKKIKVQLKGLSPLLMNSPKAMILASTQGLKSKTEKYDIEGDAEKVAYKTKDGELYVPAEAIKGCLVNAAAYKKRGKCAARAFIAGGVFITPNEIGLGTKDYEIDIRTVVIQRARVVKGRPKIENWKIDFTLMYNEKMIADHNIIKQILEEGGQRIGILDFRPQKMGSFGMFEVSKWLPEK